MHKVYDKLYYSAEMNEVFSDASALTCMLRFEAALAQAQADHRLIPRSSADVIVACCSAELVNLELLAEQSALAVNPAIPLVKQLTLIVKERDVEAAKYVHFGATSQDVMDTGLVLQINQALRLIDHDLQLVQNNLVELIEKHRHTVMAGRTLLTQARPITFGFKAAAWLDPLLRSRNRLKEICSNTLAIQFGGAVGTLASMNSKGLEVLMLMAKELGLQAPSFTWHTARDRIADVAAALGVLVGNLGKMAKDITLLMQTEAAEVFESAAEGKGGSSTLPHKRNPISSTMITAIAMRLPALVSSIMTAMMQEHERAVGAWHAEWGSLTEICKLTGGALKQSVNLTTDLEVDAERMRENMEMTGGLIFAENVSLALTEKIGKEAAHELLEEACNHVKASGGQLKEILLQDPRVMEHLNSKTLENLFDFAASLGLSNLLIDRVLASA